MEGCLIGLNPVADQTMSAVLSAPLPSPTHRVSFIHPLRMFRDVPPCILYFATITGPAIMAGPVQIVPGHSDRKEENRWAGSHDGNKNQKCDGEVSLNETFRRG